MRPQHTRGIQSFIHQKGRWNVLSMITKLACGWEDNVETKRDLDVPPPRPAPSPAASGPQALTLTFLLQVPHLPDMSAHPGPASLGGCDCLVGWCL